ncbi:putative sodium/metabolite cotransporter BASS5, chloroplastic [Trifolium repens]|nr:putative sodium/metabolite cotransporter BASS5, chloroplastic [Trifolium repens]
MAPSRMGEANRVNQLHNVSRSNLSLYHVSKPQIYAPFSTNVSSKFSICLGSHFPQYRIFKSKLPLKCASANSSDSVLHDPIPQVMKQKTMSILEILKQANSLIPYVVFASTLLALAMLFEKQPRPVNRKM